MEEIIINIILTCVCWFILFIFEQKKEKNIEIKKYLINDIKKYKKRNNL